jgi:type II secretory pathway pseudopilin PulG
MTHTKPIRRRSEEGYILVAVIFLLALLALSLSIAAPRVAREIQRDRERETMQRGKQYIRAIQLYYRKFHAYPPNADALVKTQEIRYLRKKYIDPMTGKDDWKPIMFGQNKVPTAMGFFGQPLAGSASTVAGIGPSGGNTGASAFGGTGSSTGSSSIFGSTDSGSGSSTGTSPGTGTTGSSTDASGSTGSTTSSGSSSFGTGSSTGFGGQSSGQTFGGAGIIGFSPGSSKQSILVYKKKNHYNEWEFVYDPLSEMKTISGNTGNIGTPASSTSSPVGSSSFGSSGSSFGSSSFGNSSFGASSSTTATTQP